MTARPTTRAEIIESYGERIVPILKANGGHGSALNAGFAASRGEIVMFLDADDELIPEAVAQVVKRGARASRRRSFSSR